MTGPWERERLLFSPSRGPAPRESQTWQAWLIRGENIVYRNRKFCSYRNMFDSWIKEEKENSMKKKVFVSSPTDWGDEVPWNGFLLRIWEKPTLSALFVFLLSSNILILNRNRQFSEDGAFSLFILSFHCLRSGLALQTGEYQEIRDKISVLITKYFVLKKTKSFVSKNCSETLQYCQINF